MSWRNILDSVTQECCYPRGFWKSHKSIILQFSIIPATSSNRLLEVHQIVNWNVIKCHKVLRFLHALRSVWLAQAVINSFKKWIIGNSWANKSVSGQLCYPSGALLTQRQNGTETLRTPDASTRKRSKKPLPCARSRNVSCWLSEASRPGHTNKGQYLTSNIPGVYQIDIIVFHNKPE